MRITSQAENDILFVSVTGDIDMWNAKKFKENLVSLSYYYKHQCCTD